MAQAQAIRPIDGTRDPPVGSAPEKRAERLCSSGEGCCCPAVREAGPGQKLFGGLVEAGRTKTQSVIQSPSHPPLNRSHGKFAVKAPDFSRCNRHCNVRQRGRRSGVKGVQGGQGCPQSCISHRQWPGGSLMGTPNKCAVACGSRIACPWLGWKCEY
ncbi:hypothetical protein CONLIGDRAFT_351338 [Coniochaeta ligniaria NRRL 30616]|uniref:Uncharacterized protein n=1 Tax=Coniochaeta ligniaria NRRL 30616 TaxID=1408157 RepID=A0A1J7JJ99_9PEZI|nr:hypothetical protein CONLIGDRAFT_351338 [Coniochaeta ligniaria NRRL 30616]